MSNPKAPATSTPNAERDYNVKPSVAVSRAFSLVDAFLEMGHTASLTELSRHTGIPKSTAFRMLVQLTKSGHVIRSGSSYRLGIRMFELGNHFVHARPHGLKQVAAPLLGDLFIEFRSQVGLSVLERTDVVLVDQLTRSRGTMESPVVGGRAPALTTASGKAMLAFTDAETREQALAQHLEDGRRTSHTLMHAGQIKRQLLEAAESGVAFTRDEFAVGECAVASPVLVNGRPIAAVSVSGKTAQLDRRTVESSVLRTARLIATKFIAERELEEDYKVEDLRWDLQDEFPQA